MPEHRAREWMHHYARKYPLMWDLYAHLQSLHEYRRKHGKAAFDRMFPPAANGPFAGMQMEDWPDWCWAPSSAAHSITETLTAENARAGRDLRAPSKDAAGIAAVAAWRATQGIYRFDETLLEELWETPVGKRIPCEVLLRLPAWCCYVELGDSLASLAGDPLHGFFAHLDWDSALNQGLIRFALDVEGSEGLVPLGIVLADDLETGLRLTEERMTKSLQLRYGKELTADSVKQLAKTSTQLTSALAPKLLNLVLYLCCDEADVPPSGPRPVRVAQTKKGRRFLPHAHKSPIYECGTRVGAALRKAREQVRYIDSEITGRRVDPHVRAPHYHHFWTGPRDGERQLICKWFPPIQVGFRGVPEVATIHPVED